MKSNCRLKNGRFAKGHEKIRTNESYKRGGESLKKVVHTLEWNKKVAIKRKEYLDKNPMPQGEKHWSWKGGSGTERHQLMGKKEYKKWRMSVFLRDNFTCQFCGIRGVYLQAHHIKSWTKYPKLRYEIDNGVTLCLNCHSLTDNYKKHNH